MTTIGESLLNTDQVCELLAISRRTLFDLTKAGRLPSVKIGRHNRYRRSDVEQIMRNGLAA